MNVLQIRNLVNCHGDTYLEWTIRVQLMDWQINKLTMDRDFHNLPSMWISKLNHCCVKTTQLECMAVRMQFIYAGKFQIMWPTRIVGWRRTI